MTIEIGKTAGDDVDSRCLKCKNVTNHTIIAMSGEIIAKVQCNSCGARHNYRPPADKEKDSGSTTLRRRDGNVIVSKGKKVGAKSSKKKVPTQKAISRLESNFNALSDGIDTCSPIPYCAGVLLKTGDVLEHSVFGLGIVSDILPPGKAQVTFREHGIKILVCKLN